MPSVAYSMTFSLPTRREYRLVPWHVMIVKDRIFRIIGNARLESKFADLTAYALVDRGAYHDLCLLHRNGAEGWIGVPATLDQTVLEDVLNRHGLGRIPADKAPGDNDHEPTLHARIEAILGNPAREGELIP